MYNNIQFPRHVTNMANVISLMQKLGISFVGVDHRNGFLVDCKCDDGARLVQRLNGSDGIATEDWTCNGYLVFTVNDDGRVSMPL